MQWVVIALTMTCACNRVFDLHDVVPRDAQFFDGLADVAHFCPPAGTLPEYSPIVRQAIDQDCRDYTFSQDTGLAVAMCADVDQIRRIFQGPIDHELVRSTGPFPTITADISIDTPRLSPEGDVLLVGMFDLTTVVSTYMTFRPTAGGSWTRGPDANLPQFGGLSVPSRGPDRHILFHDGSGKLQELHDGGTLSTWTHIRDLNLGEPIEGAYLSPDGLRLIAMTVPGLYTHVNMWYADRAGIGDAFSAPTQIALPRAIDAFVSEDCTRVYVSSIQNVFYVAEK